MRRLRSSCSFVNRNSDSFPTGILDRSRSEVRSSWPCGPDGVRVLTQLGDGAMVVRRILTGQSIKGKDLNARRMEKGDSYSAPRILWRRPTPLTTQVQLVLHRGPTGCFRGPEQRMIALLTSNTIKRLFGRCGPMLSIVVVCRNRVRPSYPRYSSLGRLGSESRRRLRLVAEK